jgi:HSP20 family protein
MRLIRYNTPTYAPAAYPTLLDEMDRLFDAAFPNGGFNWKGQFPLDLYKDTDAFVVRAELPGFRKEDLAIDLADGVLTITGTQKTETKTEAAEKTTEPAPERRLTRSVALPENIDVEKIAAAYENGVLTVTLPKREEAKPRKVAIEVK